MWVNIGDSYAGSGKGIGTDRTLCKEVYTDDDIVKTDWKQTGIPAKSLVGIPERFAIRMTDELGMIRRNTIIWWKRNAMPSSVKDRFTVDFEPVYFFTKSVKYWFEQQKEPYTAPLDRWGGDKLKADGESAWDKGTGQSSYRDRNMRPDPQGRNKRCVWNIPTKPFPGAHFAVFPDTLVEPMLSAGCPLDGWVLDPFAGSGTVGVVAQQQGKNFVGIELNPAYITLAESRM
jgi:DNA modification methylase